MTPLRAAVVFLALLLASWQGHPTAAERWPGLVQQQTAMIAGQVVEAEGGRGVPESIVTLTPVSAPGAPPVSPLARDATSRKVIADGSGRFVFAGLASGRYTLTSTKPGHVSGAFGKLVPRGPGATLEIGGGERFTNARILMWKHAIVAGRVVDEAGEPVVGAEVRILRRSLSSGRPGLSDAATAVTDDRGMYRVATLEPAGYVVGVMSTSTSIPAQMIEDYFRATGSARAEMQQALFSAAPTMTASGGPGHVRIGELLLQVEGRMVPPPSPSANGALMIYPTTFYAQAQSATTAETITLKAGEFRAGIDIQLRPVPTVRVSGRLEGPDGPVGISAVHLLPAAPGLAGAASSPVATTVANGAGAFTFLGVPPGQYEVRVLKLPAPEPSGAQMTVVQTPQGQVSRGAGGAPAALSTQPTFWASQSLAVGNRDIADLRVPLRTGFRISGALAFEGGVPGFPPQRISPYFDPADSWLLAALLEVPVASDGSFTSMQVPPGLYRFSVPVPTGWFVKNILSGGRDLAELPFELTQDLSSVVVTLSNRGARLFGTVRTAASAPDAEAGVLVFPVDRRQWVDYGAYPRGIKDTRTGRDGSYAVDDLPPGQYFVVALPQAAIDWTQSGFFESLSRIATRVTLAEGEQRALELRTATVK